MSAASHSLNEPRGSEDETATSIEPPAPTVVMVSESAAGESEFTGDNEVTVNNTNNANNTGVTEEPNIADIVPVFCTANIPSTLLDTFLSRVNQYGNGSIFLPRIITHEDLAAPQDVKTPSQTPILANFTSPFAGMTVTQVNDIVVAKFQELDIFTYCYYCILDQRSIENENCLIIEGGDDFDLDDEMKFLRTDFYYSMSFLSAAALGVTDLGQSLERGIVHDVHNNLGF